MPPKPDPFQAVADPSRRKMLGLLAGQSLNVNHIAEHFRMSRPAVSKHLKLLTQAGFIRVQELGRERKCSLRPEGFKAIQDWAAYYDQFWKTKLEKLDDLLRSREQPPAGHAPRNE